MAKYLVIVESPAKVKTIKKFLGTNYEVLASNGHVRDLPKSYLGIDVDNDFAMKYITIRGKKDVIDSLKKEVKNFVITNYVTGEMLKINDTLILGETIKVYQDNGRIRVQKQDADGLIREIFALLDDDSNLFWMHSGDNYIEKSADRGSDDLNVLLSFNTPYMGVLA